MRATKHDDRAHRIVIIVAREYIKNNYSTRKPDVFKEVWRGINDEPEFRNVSSNDLALKGIDKKAVIDIANTPFDEYPEYWKNKNIILSELLIDLLDKYGKEYIGKLKIINKYDRDKFGEIIYNNWVQNLPPGYDNIPEFKDLSELSKNRAFSHILSLQKCLMYGIL